MDEFGTDTALYAEFEFDILDNAHASPQAAFNSFISFIENHHSAFDQNLRSATLKIENELAEAFHKNSEKEKVLLEKLRRKLESLPVRDRKLRATK